jgi:hypothetical protein
LLDGRRSLLRSGGGVNLECPQAEPLAAQPRRNEVDAAARRRTSGARGATRCSCGRFLLAGGLPVVLLLMFGRWTVRAGAVQPAVVVPVHPFGEGEFDRAGFFHGPRRLITSVLNRPVVVSARALS